MNDNPFEGVKAILLAYANQRQNQADEARYIVSRMAKFEADSRAYAILIQESIAMLQAHANCLPGRNIQEKAS